MVASPARTVRARLKEFLIMFIPRPFRAAAGLGVGTALLLSACGGGSASSTSADTPAVSAPAETAAGGTAAGGLAASDPAVNGNGEFGFSEAEIARRQTAVEDLIRDCMANEGFEYVPVSPEVLRTAMDSNSQPPGFGDPQTFLDNFGYGISTLWEAEAGQGGSSIGSANAAIRDALTPEERTAYDKALTGGDLGGTQAIALDREDLSFAGGCSRAALDEVFPEDNVQQGQLNPDDAAGEKAAQDQRVIDAAVAWSACMSDAGYSYDNPKAAEADIETQLDAIVGDVPTATDGPLEFDRAALEALNADEIALAKADDTCQVDTGYRDVNDAVSAEYRDAAGN